MTLYMGRMLSAVTDTEANCMKHKQALRAKGGRNTVCITGNLTFTLLFLLNLPLVSMKVTGMIEQLYIY